MSKANDNPTVIFTKDKNNLLGITENEFSCLLENKNEPMDVSCCGSMSITVTSNNINIIKASKSNLWTNEMELSCAQELEKLTKKQPIPSDIPIRECDVIRANANIEKTCREQKFKYGLPPFTFLNETSKVDNPIDANFLFTDDHQQFYYMQRFNNFPNVNSMEYVKEMIQPYIKFMDDMAGKMAQSKQRKQLSSYNLSAGRKQSHLIRNNQTRISGTVEKILTLLSKMKQRIKLFNNNDLLQGTAMKIIILMKKK